MKPQDDISRSDAPPERGSVADHAGHALHGPHQSGHAAHHAHRVEDFKRRFWISLAVTVPIVILSPMVQEIPGALVMSLGTIIVAINARLIHYTKRSSGADNYGR